MVKTEEPALAPGSGWRPRLMRAVALPAWVWLLASATVAAILLTAAYQARPTYVLGLGDTPRDTGLVRDFNAAERQRPQDGGRRFRWTRDTSEIVFPGIGRGRTEITLLLANPANPRPDTQILANDAEIATFHVAPDFRTYTAEAPAAAMTSGSLALTFVIAPFNPPGDRRTLGLVVQEVRLRSLERGFVLPPARIALSLWAGALLVALALLIAGMGGTGAFAGGVVAANGMAAFLVWNRLFLTANAGGVVRAGLLMVGAVALIRLAVPPLSRRLGLPTTARDIRWLAVIAGGALALRFAGVLHPGIIIGDLTFHIHRFDDVAVRHMLLLPVESKEFGGGTILYAPTPYLVMLPLSWVIHNRPLMLFLFALGIDAVRFCIVWFVARRVTGDRRTADLTVLVMAVVPVGWVIYSWGIFANIFAEGMLTVLFALLALATDQLAGPRRWRWCAIFAAVIALTLLAHVGVFVLTAATLALFLLGLIALNLRRRARPWAGAVLPFAVAGLAAAAIAFALFYRLPFHDLVTGRHPAPVEQETASNQAAPAPHVYRTGGATPDDRNGLPVVSTRHLSVALARETWEMSYAFYRLWPVPAALLGLALLWRSAFRTEDSRLRTEGGESHSALSTQHSALTLSVWMLVAAIMLVVGIVARRYVRYPLYALPAISLSSGILLAWLTRRGRWGTCLAIALLVVSAIFLARFWYDRIVYDGKVIV